MPPVSDFFNKYTLGIQVVLITLAVILLTYNITRPLVDYDEATYAKVVTDTIYSGDIISMSLSDNQWFEKPPLYFWIDMLFVKILGFNEATFRVPSIVFTILSLWFVYLIVRKETRDTMAASIAFLILLTTPFFYFYGKEMRLDSAVVFTILAALYVWLIRDERKKCLALLFPIIAAGLLFKSVIALIAFPAIFVYSLLRREWNWLTDSYLWFGLVIAIAIWLPWHILETFRFGASFWDNYFGHQVFARATTTLTGTNNVLEYLNNFLAYCSVWFFSIVATICIYAALFFRVSDKRRLLQTMAPPLVIAIGIIVVFSMVRTHLTPYLMPAFPFLAIFVGMLYHEFTQRLRGTDLVHAPKLFCAAIIIFGFAYSHSALFQPSQFYTNDEVQIGQIYKKNNVKIPAPLYSLDWLVFETMNYYGAAKVISLDPHAISGNVISGPFYIVTTLGAGKYLFSDDFGVIQPRYQNLELLYLGHNLLLAYSSTDLQMPTLMINGI